MSPTITKLTFDGMIQHFQDRGVTFNHIDENEAKEILKRRNYFFKLRSYRANFDKDQYSKYKKLDFGMLMDLSVIDTRLRSLILDISLNIEHSLKTKLLQLITDDPNEDGISIVDDFIQYNSTLPNEQPLTYKSLFGNAASAKSTLTHDLFKKYKDNPPIWVIFEVISYPNLVKFAEFYQQERGHNVDANLREVIENLKHVKFMRNAAAHNNPLIRNIKNKNIPGAQSSIERFFNQIKNTRPNQKTFMKNDTVHNFVATLFVFDKLVESEGIRDKTHENLLDFSARCAKKRDYYINIHSELVSIYRFIDLVIEHIVDQ